MDKRSTRGVLEEWRKQWLSGQTPCRTSTGAACRGGVFLRHGVAKIQYIGSTRFISADIASLRDKRDQQTGVYG
jgi:hypothetical protein